MTITTHFQPTHPTISNAHNNIYKHKYRPDESPKRYICNSKLCHDWFWLWLVTCSLSSCYWNICGRIVSWTLRNKFQWHLNKNTIVIQENELKMVCFICRQLWPKALWLCDLVVGKSETECWWHDSPSSKQCKPLKFENSLTEVEKRDQIKTLDNSVNVGPQKHWTIRSRWPIA